MNALFLGRCVAFTEHDMVIDQGNHGEAFHRFRIAKLFRRAQNVVNLVRIALAGDIFSEIGEYANPGDRVLLNRYKTGLVYFPCAHFSISGTEL